MIEVWLYNTIEGMLYKAFIKKKWGKPFRFKRMKKHLERIFTDEDIGHPFEESENEWQN